MFVHVLTGFRLLVAPEPNPNPEPRVFVFLNFVDLLVLHGRIKGTTILMIQELCILKPLHKVLSILMKQLACHVHNNQ